MSKRYPDVDEVISMMNGAISEFKDLYKTVEITVSKSEHKIAGPNDFRMVEEKSKRIYDKYFRKNDKKAWWKFW